VIDDALGDPADAILGFADLSQSRDWWRWRRPLDAPQHDDDRNRRDQSDDTQQCSWMTFKLRVLRGGDLRVNLATHSEILKC
jgi:hypothetical protein